MKLIRLSILLLVPFFGNAQTNAASHYNPNAPLGSYSNHFMQDSVAVHFAFNSDYPQLGFMGRLDDFWTNDLVLRAYTDTVGDVESNLKLAEMRLVAVEKLLTKDIVVRDRIIIGEDLSKLSDKDKRRVDVIAIKVLKVEEVKEVVQEMPAIDVKLGVPIALGIEFYNNSPNVIPEFYPELERLLGIMQVDTTLKAFLKGHVCCMPEPDLSLRRAQTVHNYLLDNGISADRITSEGFSNTQPLYEEVDEWSQQKNRRVEVVFSRD